MAAHASPFSSRPQRPRTAWRALEMHYRKIRESHLRDLFADPNRGDRMAVEGAGLYLDYSKNRLTTNTIRMLVELANESGLQARIDAMFRGEKVNITEGQAASHVALRAPRGTSIFVDGQNVVPQVHATLDKMRHFCNHVRDGAWLGHSGKRLRHVFNIGTAGLHLGPLMTFEALRHYKDSSLTFHFVGNEGLAGVLGSADNLDPAESLFIVSSRTFTTPETISNAQAARAWLLGGLGAGEEALSKHFVAVSKNREEVARFGIGSINVFEFWDWMGESYSLGSAVNLSTMLSIGPENFMALLDGLHQMDMHYLATPFERNLPVLLGLISVWYNNLFGAQTAAIFPYEQRLSHFPWYLQQLTMGSNGKNITVIGTEVAQQTSPIYWGAIGTNAQYSFSQFLNQGTRLVPCDFIAFAQPSDALQPQHDILIANLFAQAEALAFGKSAEDVKAEGTADWLVPHRVLRGNHPSNILLAPRLTPEYLGKLIALYEHSVYTQGVIWNIDSFDEWGVDFGNELAEGILLQIDDEENSQLEYDSSTKALIRRYRQLRTAS